MYNDRKQQQSVTIVVSAIDGIQMPQQPAPAPMAPPVAQNATMEAESPEGGAELSQQGKTAFVAALEAIRQYHMAKDPAEKAHWKTAADNLHQVVLQDSAQMMSLPVEYTALLANNPASGMGGEMPGPKPEGKKPVGPKPASRASEPPMPGKMVRAFDRNAPKPVAPTAPPQAQGPVNVQQPASAVPKAGEAPKTPDNTGVGVAAKESEQGLPSPAMPLEEQVKQPTTPVAKPMDGPSGNSGQLTQAATEETINKKGLNFGSTTPDAASQSGNDDSLTFKIASIYRNKNKMPSSVAAGIVSEAAAKPVSSRAIYKVAEEMGTDPAPSYALAQQSYDAAKEKAKTPTPMPEPYKVTQEPDKAQSPDAGTPEAAPAPDAEKPQVVPEGAPKKKFRVKGLNTSGDYETHEFDAVDEKDAAKQAKDKGILLTEGSEIPPGEAAPPSQTPQPDDNSTAEVPAGGADTTTPTTPASATPPPATPTPKPADVADPVEVKKKKYQDLFDVGTKPQSANPLGVAATAFSVIHDGIKAARSFVGGKYGDAAGYLGSAAATREGFRNDEKILAGRKAEAEGEKKRWDRVIKRATGMEFDAAGKKVDLTTEEAVASRRAFKRYDLEVKKALADAMGIPNAPSMTSDELNVAVDKFFNEKSPESMEKEARHDQMLIQNQKFVDTMASGGTLTPEEARGFKNDLHNLTPDELKNLAADHGLNPFGSRKLLISQLKSKIDSHEAGRVAREKAKEGSKELLDEQVDRLKLSLNNNGEMEPEEPITKKSQITSMTNTFGKMSDDEKVATLKRMVDDPGEIDDLKGTGYNARFREEIMKHVIDPKTRGEATQDVENDAVAAKVKGGQPITPDQVKSTLRSLKGISENDLRSFADKLGVAGFATKGIGTLKTDVENAVKGAVPEEQKGPTDKQKAASEEYKRVVNEAAGFVDKLGKDLSGTLDKSEIKTLKGHLSKLERADLEKFADAYGLDKTSSESFLKEQIGNIISSREASKVARDKKNEGTSLGLGEDVAKLNLNMDEMSGVERPTAPITAAKIAQMKQDFSKQTEEVQKSLLGSLGVDDTEVAGLKGAGLTKRFAEELAKHELKLPKEGESQQTGENFNVADKVAKGEPITEDEFDALKRSFPKDRQDLTAMANVMGIETPKAMGNDTIKVKMTRMARKLVQKQDDVNKQLGNKSSRIANDISGWADHLSEDPTRTLDPEFAAAFVGKVKDLTTSELEETAEKLGLDPDNPSTGELYDDSVLVEMIKAAVKKRITPKSELNPTRSVDPGDDEERGDGDGDQGGGGGAPKTPPGTPPAPPADPAGEATVPDTQLPISKPTSAAPEIPNQVSGSSSKVPENTGELIATSATKKPASGVSKDIVSLAEEKGLRGDFTKNHVGAEHIPDLVKDYFNLEFEAGSKEKADQDERIRAIGALQQDPAAYDFLFNGRLAQPATIQKNLDLIAANLRKPGVHMLAGTDIEGDVANKRRATAKSANTTDPNLKDKARDKIAAAGIKVDPKDEDALETGDDIGKRMAEISSQMNELRPKVEDGDQAAADEMKALKTRAGLLRKAFGAAHSQKAAAKDEKPPEGDTGATGEGDKGPSGDGGDGPAKPNPTPTVAPEAVTEQDADEPNDDETNAANDVLAKLAEGDKPAKAAELTGKSKPKKAAAGQSEKEKLAEERKKAGEWFDNATNEEIRAKLKEAGLDKDKDKGKDSVEAIAKKLAGVLKKKDGEKPEPAPEPDEDWASRFEAGGDLARQAGESEAAHEARVRVAGEKKTAAEDKKRKALAAAKKKAAENSAAEVKPKPKDGDEGGGSTVASPPTKPKPKPTTEPVVQDDESKRVSERIKEQNAAPKPKTTPQASWDGIRLGSDPTEAEASAKMDSIRNHPDMVRRYEDKESGTEAFVIKGKGKLSGQYGVNLVDTGTGENVGDIRFYPTIEKANAAAMKAANQKVPVGQDEESKRVNERIKEKNSPAAPKPQPAKEPEAQPKPEVKEKEPRVNERANDGIDDSLITEVKAAQVRRRDANFMAKKEAESLGKRLEPLNEEQLKKFLKAHGMAPIGQEKMTKAEIIDRLIKGWSGDFD